MSFPSCIKIPVSKNSIAPEFNSHNGFTKESISYNELVSVANKVFGHGHWSHSVTSQTVDFVEYVMGKYHIGCAAFVRVQLADGTFHEDMGYSNTESAAKGSAIYSARSSSIALALKKALLCFGGEIEERINEITPKTSKVKQESNKLKEEKSNETPIICVKDMGSCIKEAKSAEKVPPLQDSCEIKQPAKALQSVSTLKRNKSPRPTEPEAQADGECCSHTSQENVFRTSIEQNFIPQDAFIPIATDIEVIMTDECQEPIKVTTDNTNAINKDGPSTAMTDEEIRLERKRKQKQKQEEYKKLMKEKQMKSDDKPNPRY